MKFLTKKLQVTRHLNLVSTHGSKPAASADREELRGDDDKGKDEGDG